MGVDPGDTQTAFVVMQYPEMQIIDKGILNNYEFKAYLKDHASGLTGVIFEQVKSYGMAVGETVFETVFWTGIFFQICVDKLVNIDRIGRIEIKNILCHTSRAKDANIRQALIDRYGGDKAIGTKKNPGSLYGMKSDMWAALAVVTAYIEGAINK